MNEFVAKRSTGRLLLLVLGCVLFVAGSAWMTFGSRPPSGLKYWLAAAGMPFFGLCGLYIASMLFAKGPEVAVGARGILWRRWTGDWVPWSAISGLRSVDMAADKVVVIDLHDPAAYPLGGLLGRTQASSRNMLGGGDVFLTLVGTDRTFEELVAAIAHFAPPHLGR